ncbi:MAG: type II toxin-antitoxin system VapB family antitoxin [Bryobacterales bacterium]|nr:type II toxin-antitoxin system VapB family antitoxin [Bryobacterales bacterium]
MQDYWNAESKHMQVGFQLIHHWTVKTTIDIPENELADAIKFTKAKTKREAVVCALKDFNHRMRMTELTRYSGTCADLISPQELQALRRKR